MADLQYDIAKDYLDIAKWWRNHYNSTYLPCEDKELEEAWALEKEDPLYDITIGRHRTYGQIEFAGMLDKAIQCTSPYCVGVRQARLKDVINAKATALAALSNMGYRNERSYVEAMNDRRWQRRAEVLNRGRDRIANNVSYSNMAVGIFGNLIDQASASASGAMRYLFYSFNKRPTTYPETFMGPGAAAQMASGPARAMDPRDTRGFERSPANTGMQNIVHTSGNWRQTSTGEYMSAVAQSSESINRRG